MALPTSYDAPMAGPRAPSTGHISHERLARMLRRLADGPGQSPVVGMAGHGTAASPRDRWQRQRMRAARARHVQTGRPRWTLLPRDDVPMKLPHGRRAHEGARPAWRPRPAWLWMLAFRRQHHQETATVLSDLDATERRIAELYAKAVEQLGSDEAQVRFGGLYALERLAQDNPAHRQTIVNVICAYLRMPFSPTAPQQRSPRPPKARKSLALRVKRRLMGLAAHGSKKDRCVLPRSVFLPSICVMTGPKISSPPILRTHVSGITSASISPAPPSSISTS